MPVFSHSQIQELVVTDYQWQSCGVEEPRTGAGVPPPAPVRRSISHAGIKHDHRQRCLDNRILAPEEYSVFLLGSDFYDAVTTFFAEFLDGLVCVYDFDGGNVIPVDLLHGTHFFSVYEHQDGV